jgi:hypothetical protein
MHLSQARIRCPRCSRRGCFVCFLLRGGHVARLADHGFELLPTAQRPHFTARLWRADDQELGQLLAACGSPQPNPQYARSTIWQEER